jgi:hypothetical protein
VGDFLLDRGRSEQDVRAGISQQDASAWIYGSDVDGVSPLETKLEDVANLANAHKIIFHEPHHELTPGMLLIDEIFRRMVKEVAGHVERINADPKKDIGVLQEFVNNLAKDNGEAGSPGSNFGPYILKAGDHAPDPALPNEMYYHVDPSRIELFLDPTGHIRAASVIVGAWKGGTHSAGHTT